MKFLYDFLIFIASLILPVIAVFNKKMKLFVEGRKEIFSKIDELKNQSTIWFHAASLGEFEQSRPIIERIKKDYPNCKILVTFFSPSGYEIRKNYALADIVCYLPLDSTLSVKRFVRTVNPKLAVFIKYEFWPNLLNELKVNNIPTILVSGILRKKQIFFKFHGGFMRKSLQAFHHFFVQDTTSKKLLESINYSNVTIAGDTRFDRVSKILAQENSLDFIEEFKNNQYTVIAGSTWQDDEELLVHYINNLSTENEKFIIAPHNIKSEAILELQKSINRKTVLYSSVISSAVEKSNNLKDISFRVQTRNLKEYQVFIIDNIGILTKIYAAADVAYVGGGLKTGLHNILEPATFGIPVIIGNKYDKFKEAVDLVAKKGVISISNQKEFSTILNKLYTDKEFRKTTGKINATYINENVGATEKIMNYLKNKI